VKRWLSDFDLFQTAISNCPCLFGFPSLALNYVDWSNIYYFVLTLTAGVSTFGGTVSHPSGLQTED
jgi:hypothetical protein